MLALLAIAAGCALGLAFGGRLSGLAHLDLKLLALPLVGFAALVVLHYGPSGSASPPLRAGLLTASYLPVVVFLWLNRRHVPLLLVAVGLVLNLSVVVANGGMPVSPAASRSAGLRDPSRDPDVLWGKHVLRTPSTRLMALGDSIPVPIPGFRQVVSIGDVAVLAGIGWLVARAVASRRDDEPSEPARDG